MEFSIVQEKLEQPLELYHRDMMDSEIHIVTKIEHHALATCPCDECVAERERRSLSKCLPQYPFKRMSVEVASTLGFVRGRRCPRGSLARQLADKK